MSRAIACALLATVMAAVTVAGGSQASNASAPATKIGHLAWLTAWGSWAVEIDRDTGGLVKVDFGDLAPANRAAAHRFVKGLASCDGYRTRVPKPPVVFRNVERLSSDACRQLAQVASTANGWFFDGYDAQAPPLEKKQFDANLSAAYGALRQASDAVVAAITFGRRLPTKGGLLTTSRVEPKLSEAASALARVKTEVRCWSKRDWLVANAEKRAAFHVRDAIDPNVVLLNGIIHLAYRHCASLANLIYHGPQKVSDRDLAFALILIPYDTWRIRQASKAKSECYGLQSIASFARRLGASPARGRQLADIFWRDQYPSDQRCIGHLNAGRTARSTRHPATASGPEASFRTRPGARHRAMSGRDKVPARRPVLCVLGHVSVPGTRTSRFGLGRAGRQGDCLLSEIAEPRSASSPMHLRPPWPIIQESHHLKG